MNNFCKLFSTIFVCCTFVFPIQIPGSVTAYYGDFYLSCGGLLLPYENYCESYLFVCKYENYWSSKLSTWRYRKFGCVSAFLDQDVSFPNYVKMIDSSINNCKIQSRQGVCMCYFNLIWLYLDQVHYSFIKYEIDLILFDYISFFLNIYCRFRFTFIQ